MENTKPCHNNMARRENTRILFYSIVYTHPTRPPMEISYVRRCGALVMCRGGNPAGNASKQNGFSGLRRSRCTSLGKSEGYRARTLLCLSYICTKSGFEKGRFLVYFFFSAFAAEQTNGRYIHPEAVLPKPRACFFLTTTGI